ncbi:MAG: hypothetical protein H6744_20955 [Deltaproteobacteria bacterium]|nr:hypothetical protein [Deltaproteobacteria bacterium]MCB9789153.1 hypothetical protein [Deltaproteobacteria bacterium]
MASRLELQPLVTVAGDTTSGDVTIIQPIDLWASIGNWGAAIFTTAVSHVSVISGDTVDVMLMTCPNKFRLSAPGPQRPLEPDRSVLAQPGLQPPMVQDHHHA